MQRLEERSAYIAVTCGTLEMLEHETPNHGIGVAHGSPSSQPSWRTHSSPLHALYSSASARTVLSISRA